MKKQNVEKELYPILENESIKIGTFKANRSIDALDIIKENIKFWKSYDGHKLPEKQVKRVRYYNGTRTQNIIKLYKSTPALIKFVREHANDYNTLKRKDVPSCINICGRKERYFSVYIEKFGEISFKEVLNVFPLLPKSYLNNI